MSFAGASVPSEARMAEFRERGAPGLAGASSFSATPDTTRIVAVACTTAAVARGGDGGASEVARAVAANKSMSTPNVLSRKW